MHVPAVEAVGRKRRELEERRAGIDEQIDPLARKELAARDVTRPRLLAAALGRGGELLAQVGDQRLHGGGILGELAPVRIDGGAQGCHSDPDGTNNDAGYV